MKAKPRIEYIDAMRGFTMILVVYSHICSFCLGDAAMGFNDIFFLFRLPCFFMISGWLFAPAAMGMQQHATPLLRMWELVWKKFRVQIVPTFIFLLLLAPPPELFSRLGATKGGYWFTFALFEFFVLYLLCTLLHRRKRQEYTELAFAVIISVAAFCYDIYYNRYFCHWGCATKTLGFLSFMTWRYYLFFFLGAWIRRHFDTFLRWTSRPLVMIFVVLGFLAIAVCPHLSAPFMAYLRFALGGVLGMIMVFSFFRVCQQYFTREKLLGRCLQYTGSRTLDIYLLHYFFLPRFLTEWGETLRGCCQPLLELIVSMFLALCVLLICLFVSRILRLSPFLARWLFGVS